MDSFKKTKVIVLVFCLLIPSTIGQLRPAWRRSIGAMKTPPLVNSLLPQINPDGVGLPNLENGLQEWLLKSGKIKSPSYRHKLLQGHGDMNTDSIHGYNPKKLFMNHYLLSKLMPSYPVAAKVVKMDGKDSGGVNMPVKLDNEDIDFWTTIGTVIEPQLFVNPDEPNYNPYVGAQALTNMTKFFHHLRENLRAVQSMELEDKDDKIM